MEFLSEKESGGQYWKTCVILRQGGGNLASCRNKEDSSQKNLQYDDKEEVNS